MGDNLASNDIAGSKNHFLFHFSAVGHVLPLPTSYQVALRLRILKQEMIQ